MPQLISASTVIKIVMLLLSERGQSGSSKLISASAVMKVVMLPLCHERDNDAGADFRFCRRQNCPITSVRKETKNDCIPMMEAFQYGHELCGFICDLEAWRQGITAEGDVVLHCDQGSKGPGVRGRRPRIEAEGDVILHCDQGSEGLGVRGQRPRVKAEGDVILHCGQGSKGLILGRRPRMDPLDLVQDLPFSGAQRPLIDALELIVTFFQDHQLSGCIYVVGAWSPIMDAFELTQHYSAMTSSTTARPREEHGRPSLRMATLDLNEGVLLDQPRAAPAVEEPADSRQTLELVAASIVIKSVLLPPGVEGDQGRTAVCTFGEVTGMLQVSPASPLILARHLGAGFVFLPLRLRFFYQQCLFNVLK
ncbi:hypothetical protein CB1_000726003 [Camelus ferus]|nr:hypothetical protein CB1_000726003 [Camelus ferus]